MPRERTQSVCDGFSSALKTYGVPAQVLTDNGKVYTGAKSRIQIGALGFSDRPTSAAIV
jgi:hypothetical protein